MQPPTLSASARNYLPAIVTGGWADCFDAYCEELAFSVAEVERMFKVRALPWGCASRLHADQLSNLGGAALAARHQALSADHLEIHRCGRLVAALAGSGCVAVLLPAAYYFLRETQLPPIALLRRAGVPLAVATDCNPGTAPVASILAAMNFAALEFGLSVDELPGWRNPAGRACARSRARMRGHSPGLLVRSGDLECCAARSACAVARGSVHCMRGCGTGSLIGRWIELNGQRCIAHLDMDAFYASVELLRYPQPARTARW